MGAREFGIVNATKGEVFARNEQGLTRRLAAGDPLFERDVIITAAGSTASVTPATGATFDVAEQQSMRMEGMGSVPVPVEGATPAPAVASVATTAATVIDAEALLEEEAAAAGLAGGGAEGGHSFVDLQRIVETVGGVGYAFPVNPAGGPPRIAGNALSDGLPTAGMASAGFVNEDAIVEAGGNRGGIGDIGDDVLAVTSGRLVYSFGPDGPAGSEAFRWTGVTLPEGELTAGGQPVVMQISTDGLLLRGVIDGGQTTVFEVRMTDPATGAYEVQLFRAVDHAPGGDENDLPLVFNFRVMDATGDMAAGTLQLAIDDDTPLATESAVTFAEPLQAVQVSGLKAGFVDAIAERGAGLTATNTDADAYADKLQWGDSSGRSSYAFVDNTALAGSGSLTDGSFKLGTFTHNNQAIDTGSLTSAVLEVQFMVNGQPVTHRILLNHDETPNTNNPMTSRDIITIDDASLSRTVVIDGQTFLLNIAGFKDAQGNLVTTIYTKEDAANSFDLYASIEPVTAAAVEGWVAPAYGADGPGEVLWDGQANQDGSVMVSNEYGTLTGYPDGHYVFVPLLAANVAEDAAMRFGYTVRDADGDTARGELALTMTDRSEVAAERDTDVAIEGHWARGSDMSISTVVTTPARWVAGTPKVFDSDGEWISTNGSGNTDTEETAAFTVAAADAAHQASVSFTVDRSDWGNGDKWQAVLYKSVPGDDRVIGQLANQTSEGNYVLGGISEPGTYYLRFTVVDGSNNCKEADLEVCNLKYTAYTLIPACTHTVTITAPGLVWVAGGNAVGNVMTNDSPGSEGAVVSEVDGMAIAATGYTTVEGEYGTLSINAQGAYTYTPNAADNPAGAHDEFDYTLSQADGDNAGATLRITLTDYNYSASATNSDNFVGSEGGNDNLDGLRGDDVVYGGAGDDTLRGGPETTSWDDNDRVLGGDGNDRIYGGADGDILEGGQGDDTLSGGSGTDAFVWRFGETGHDVVTDFNLAPAHEGGDIIDLRDALSGELATAESLDSYLSFSEHSSGGTLVTLDTNGAAEGGGGQTILLQNIDYVELQAYAGGESDVAIIDKLLQNGNLMTGP